MIDASKIKAIIDSYKPLDTKRKIKNLIHIGLNGIGLGNDLLAYGCSLITDPAIRFYFTTEIRHHNKELGLVTVMVSDNQPLNGSKNNDNYHVSKNTKASDSTKNSSIKQIPVSSKKSTNKDKTKNKNKNNQSTTWMGSPFSGHSAITLKKSNNKSRLGIGAQSLLTYQRNQERRQLANNSDSQECQSKLTSILNDYYSTLRCIKCQRIIRNNPQDIFDHMSSHFPEIGMNNTMSSFLSCFGDTAINPRTTLIDSSSNFSKQSQSPISTPVTVDKSPLQEKKEKYDDNGVIEIPWTCVRFFDGYISVWHPNHMHDGAIRPRLYPDSRIKKSLGKISELLIKRLPPIVAKVSKGWITELVNIPKISDCIEVIDQPSLQPDYFLVRGKIPKNMPGLSKDIIHCLISDHDEKYLSYLCDKHLDNFKAYYLLELRVNTNLTEIKEQGFLFVLNENGSVITLVYENELEARSTIIFYVDRYAYQRAVNFVHEFFSSNTVNKRDLLQYHRVDARNSGIKDYYHVYHTTLHEWKRTLKAHLSFYNL